MPHVVLVTDRDIDAPRPVIGGLGIAVAGLRLGLQALGVTVDVVSRPGPDGRPATPSFGCRVARRGLGRVVVHSHHWTTHELGHRLAAALGAPHVHSPHSIAAEPATPRWCAERRASLLPAATTYASEFERRQLAAHAAPRPASLLPLSWGFDARTFARRPRRRRTDLRLLHVGRPAPHKGRERALDVAARLAAGGRRTVLTLVGPGHAPVRPGAPSGLTVCSVGNTPAPRLAREMATSDVLLATADRESFGLAVLEALATGLPVVSTRTGFAADHLAGSVAGAVSASPDPDALAAETLRVLRAGRHAERAACEIAAPYSDWRRCAQQALAVYAAALQSRSRWNASPAA
jgi:glycosyltransferase involved in cell wall biosynthesis